MYIPLQAEFFTANRDRLRDSLRDSLPAVIAGNGLLQRTADSTHSFTQDSNFWYVTGLDIPDTILVIAENKNDDFIIVPSRSANREAFDGRIDIDVIRQKSGINYVLDEAKGWQKIKQLTSETNSASCLFSNALYQSNHGMYLNPVRRRVYDKIRKKLPGIHLTDCRTQFARLRMVKQPEEIAQIKQAVKITKNAIHNTLRQFDSITPLTEGIVEAKISYEMQINGAKKQAYQPIVASAGHATTMHYVDNNGIIQQNDLVLIDMGAEIEHYAADITRTVCFGTMTERQKEIHDAVASVQLEAISLMKPGAKLKTIEMEVEKMIGKRLVVLGVLEDADDHGAVRHYYPHAVSHFLGLDVHDVGDYSMPLEKGMVLTCEPGIYIPEEGIGVRIEDDILITDSGAEIL